MSTRFLVPVPIGFIGGMVLMVILSACASVPVEHISATSALVPIPPRHSMVFLIHGDGNYLYHDSAGTARMADEDALDGARRVARTNLHSEVFIYHEQRRRRLLFLMHRPDADFYYYRNGVLMARESYRRTSGEVRFNPAVAFYKQYRSRDAVQPIDLFLYFGHEIPEFDGTGYDTSFSRESFTVTDLAHGLQQFSREGDPFDLIVLSTCNNGTPHTISALAPHATSIVASPENLHLSYFDLSPLETLDPELQREDITAFATHFAQRAFETLSANVQTSISVAVYETDRVLNYVESVKEAYDTGFASRTANSSALNGHHDCAEDPAFALPGMSNGVSVFYRPARFGRPPDRQQHSGWECWNTSTISHQSTI